MERLVHLFRQEIFEEVSKSNLYGLIFTYVWAFDEHADWDYINRLSELFESNGGVVYFVELEADVEERLERNKSPHRLMHKPIKRNIEWSEQDLRSTMEKHRLNSNDGEITMKNYIRINNTEVTPEEVATMIKEKFEL